MFLEHSVRAILTKVERDNLQSAPSSLGRRQPAPRYRVAFLSILASSLLLSGSVCQAQLNLSYSAGTLDATNHFMGGTEMRSLVPHAGKLFAGNGYWEDQPGPEGHQNAQILVLNQASSASSGRRGART